MRFKKICLLLLCTLLFAVPAGADAGDDFLELRIPCKVGESVSALMPDGTSISLGEVRALPVKANWPAYTASKWGIPGTVCATAVNAVHILLNVQDGRGRIISLVPTITLAPAAKDGAFFSVDHPAGTGLFGGYAPFTGSPVYIKTSDGSLIPLDRLPEAGEMLVIRSPLPARPDTWMVDIENRPGGRVTAWTQKGPRTVARVVRPIGGVGRFGGTEFQGIGRIRASHTGVIDISTSPRGVAGGIQIMPLTHALTSTEMASSWKMTQWMILAPLPGNPILEGTPPLFKGSLISGTQLNESLSDVWSTYGRKPLVLCRQNGGGWTHIPNISGKQDSALLDITHLRIYYPVWF